MKNNKKKSPMMKIVSAAAMLAVSASMLGTSTYAWFSMNKTVSVTGMQIDVKTNNTYLLINTGDNDTADEIQAANVKTVPLTVTDAEATMFPSSPALTEAEAAYLTASGKVVGTNASITTAGVVVDDTAKAAAVTNWFTANALAPGAATIDTTSARQLSTFEGYVIRKTAYITVADGSNSANNLTVTPTITQKNSGTDIAAVKVLVCTDDGGFTVLSSTNNGTPVDIKGSNTAVTDSTVRTVNIYIYYDGDETPVYTNNMANLKGATIDLTFDMDSTAT